MRQLAVLFITVTLVSIGVPVTSGSGVSYRCNFASSAQVVRQDSRPVETQSITDADSVISGMQRFFGAWNRARYDFTSSTEVVGLSDTGANPVDTSVGTVTRFDSFWLGQAFETYSAGDVNLGYDTGTRFRGILVNSNQLLWYLGEAIQIQASSDLSRLPVPAAFFFGSTAAVEGVFPHGAVSLLDEIINRSLVSRASSGGATRFVFDSSVGTIEVQMYAKRLQSLRVRRERPGDVDSARRYIGAPFEPDQLMAYELEIEVLAEAELPDRVIPCCYSIVQSYELSHGRLKQTRTIHSRMLIEELEERPEQAGFDLEDGASVVHLDQRGMRYRWVDGRIATFYNKEIVRHIATVADAVRKGGGIGSASGFSLFGERDAWTKETEVPRDAGSMAANDAYCGVYCVWAAAQFLSDKAVILADLLHPEYISQPGGSSFSDLLEAVQAVDLSASARKNMTLTDLQRHGGLAILHVKQDPVSRGYRHFVLCLGVTEDTAIIFDPPFPIRLVPSFELVRDWDGSGILLAGRGVDIAASWRPAPPIVWLCVPLGMLCAAFIFRRRSRSGQTSMISRGALEIGCVLLLSGSVAIVFHVYSQRGFLAGLGTARPTAESALPMLVDKVDLATIGRTQEQQPRMIDFRHPTRAEQSPILGAINVNRHMTRRERRVAMKSVPLSERVYVLCHGSDCLEAAMLAQTLQRDGYRKVVLATGVKQ
ncbi:MAG: cysteine peptidase family C39 domain-containing protein [Phycisphaerales bacterium]